MKFRHLIEIKQLHYLTITVTTCKGGGQNIIGKSKKGPAGHNIMTPPPYPVYAFYSYDDKLLFLMLLHIKFKHFIKYNSFNMHLFS